MTCLHKKKISDEILKVYVYIFITKYIKNYLFNKINYKVQIFIRSKLISQIYYPSYKLNWVQ